MYIMVTSRCNMTCAHCGHNCTAKGQDMSPETFRKAIDIAANYGEEYIVLGGGEPTLHLRFWEFLGLGLSIGHIWLATNGSITDTAIRLADMAKRGVIGCALSRDIYHDSIDDRVVEAFTKNKRPIGMDTFRDTDYHDEREIRNVTGKEIKAGRCKTGRVECLCSEIIVMPSGLVKGCSCPKATRFGNVNKKVVIPEGWQFGECYRNQFESE